MTDLSATVITLTPTQPATFPAHQGRAAHALFFHLIEAADPGLAARLHEEAQVKPFTCSNLWRAGNQGTGGSGDRETGKPGTFNLRLATCAPSETWHLRYTTLTAELTGVWVERVLPTLPQRVTFGDAEFSVEGATVSAGEHPSAGHISYADLASPYLLGSASAPARWRFSFFSPTAFRSKGMIVPIPLPDLLFGSLLDRWNAWSPVALNPEVRRYAQECIAVSNYRLRSRSLRLRERVVQRGATGRCDYVALNRDRYWCGTISALAAFAFYSGAGYMTTQGMGECRWVR